MTSQIVQLSAAPLGRVVVAESRANQAERVWLPVVGVALVEEVDEPGSAPERRFEWVVESPSGYPELEEIVLNDHGLRRVEVRAVGE